MIVVHGKLCPSSFPFMPSSSQSVAQGYAHMLYATANSSSHWNSAYVTQTPSMLQLIPNLPEFQNSLVHPEDTFLPIREISRSSREPAPRNGLECSKLSTQSPSSFQPGSSNLFQNRVSRAFQGNTSQVFSDGASQRCSSQTAQDKVHQLYSQQIMLINARQPSSDQSKQMSTYQPCSDQSKQMSTYQPCSDQSKQMSTYQPCSDQSKQMSTYQPCSDQSKQTSTYQPCSDQSKQISTYQPCSYQSKQISTYQPCSNQHIQGSIDQPFSCHSKQISAYQPYSNQCKQISAHQPFSGHSIQGSKHQPFANHSKQVSTHQPSSKQTMKGNTGKVNSNQTVQVNTDNTVANSTHLTGSTKNLHDNIHQTMMGNTNGTFPSQITQGGTHQTTSDQATKDNTHLTHPNQFIQSSTPQTSCDNEYLNFISSQVPYTEKYPSNQYSETTNQRYHCNSTNQMINATPQKLTQLSAWAGMEPRPSRNDQPIIQTQPSTLLKKCPITSEYTFSSHQLAVTQDHVVTHSLIPAYSSCSTLSKLHHTNSKELEFPLNSTHIFEMELLNKAPSMHSALLGASVNQSQKTSLCNNTTYPPLSASQDAGKNLLPMSVDKQNKGQHVHQGTDSSFRPPSKRDTAEGNNSSTTPLTKIHSSMLKEIETSKHRIEEHPITPNKETARGLHYTDPQKSNRMSTEDPGPVFCTKQLENNSQERAKRTEEWLNDTRQLSTFPISTKRGPLKLIHTSRQARSPQQTKTEVKHDHERAYDSGDAVGLFTGKLLTVPEKASFKRNSSNRNTPTCCPKQNIQNTKGEKVHILNGPIILETPQISDICDIYSKGKERVSYTLEDDTINNIRRKQLPMYQCSVMANNYQTEAECDKWEIDFANNETKDTAKPISQKSDNEESSESNLTARSSSSKSCTQSAICLADSTSPKTESWLKMADSSGLRMHHEHDNSTGNNIHHEHDNSTGNNIHHEHDNSTDNNIPISTHSQSPNTCLGKVRINASCMDRNINYRNEQFTHDPYDSMNFLSSNLQIPRKQRMYSLANLSAKPQIPIECGEISCFPTVAKCNKNDLLPLSATSNIYKSATMFTPYPGGYQNTKHNEHSPENKVADNDFISTFSNSVSKSYLTFECLENTQDVTDLDKIEPTFFNHIPHTHAEKTHVSRQDTQATVTRASQFELKSGLESQNIPNGYTNTKLSPDNMNYKKEEQFQGMSHHYSCNTSFGIQTQSLYTSTSSTDNITQRTPMHGNMQMQSTIPQLENNQMTATFDSRQLSPKMLTVPHKSSSCSTSSVSSTSQPRNDIFKKPFASPDQSFKQNDFSDETYMSVSQCHSVAGRSDVSMKSDYSLHSSASASVHMSPEEPVIQQHINHQHINHQHINHQHIHQQKLQQSPGQQHQPLPVEQLQNPQEQHTRHQEIYLTQQEQLQQFQIQFSEEFLAAQLSSGAHNDSLERKYMSPQLNYSEPTLGDYLFGNLQSSDNFLLGEIVTSRRENQQHFHHQPHGATTTNQTAKIPQQNIYEASMVSFPENLSQAPISVSSSSFAPNCQSSEAFTTQDQTHDQLNETDGHNHQHFDNHIPAVHDLVNVRVPPAEDRRNRQPQLQQQSNCRRSPSEEYQNTLMSQRSEHEQEDFEVIPSLNLADLLQDAFPQ